MAESLILTVPIIRSVLGYTVRRLDMDWDTKFISIRIKPTIGESIIITYDNIIAESIMIALNKANLSTISLHRRILERLVVDGKLPAGSVTGNPD